MRRIRLTSRQVGQRVRRGTLPEYVGRGKGKWYCSKCKRFTGGFTEMLRWSKGDRLYCTRCKSWQIGEPRYRIGRHIIVLDLTK